MAFDRLGGFLGRLKERFGADKVYEGDMPPMIESVPREVPAIQEPSDYDTMMDDFGSHWGQDREGLENIMNQIAYHESKGKNVYQTGGGPGAGLYQYETGADAGGMTARNRLANWYQSKGKKLPSWLNQQDMDTVGFDATQLSPEQQNMLFLADKRYHPTASLSPEATSDLSSWWAKNHWAGAKEGTDLYNKRISSFRRDNQPVDSTMDNYYKSDLDKLVG